MKILITGGLGGLGRHICKNLLEKGHEITIFDLKTMNNQMVANKFPDLVKWGNILDENTYKDLIPDQDVIIHLAFILPPWSETNPKAYEINVEGTRQLVKLIEQLNPNCRLIFTSSVAVFGHTHNENPPITVDHPVFATDNYSEHKIKCENIVKNSNLEWIILRFAEAPYLNVDLKPKNLKRMYSLPWDQRVEFIHPLDVALAVSNAVSIPPHQAKKTYIIGGGTQCQLIYYDQIVKLFEMFNLPPPNKEKFSNDHFYLDWYDTNTSEKVFNFQKRNFDDYIDDLRSNLGWKVGFIRFFAPLVKIFI
ncbi:MAG: NAD-dependent epimerase/dehydratase family protein [Candidatus Helarchaeota archaeon]